MEPPVNRSRYATAKYTDVSRFISYCHQIEAICGGLGGGIGRVLEIGVGSGVVAHYLRNAGVEVVTCDLDAALRPDRVADIRQLPFGDAAFDVVSACEVLEHIPFTDVPRALAELSRVSRRAVVISLPYRSTGFELVFKFPFIRTVLRRLYLDVFMRIPLRFRPAGRTPQHHWEIDCCRYPLRRIRALLGERFRIVRETRPVLNHYHYFFILVKR